MPQPHDAKTTWLELAMNLSAATVRAQYDMIRAGLAEEDALPPGSDLPYGIRQHSDFRIQADVFEDAMLSRGIDFERIEWSR